MTTISQIISSVQDSSRGKINLRLTDGSVTSLPCVYKADNPPQFFLVFPPATLPENVDLKATHPVFIMGESSTVTITAKIVEQFNDRNLHFIAQGTLDPADLREYFRVDTSTSITISFDSTTHNSASKEWFSKGSTQDLSASGALALFQNEPKKNSDIIIEISIPNKRQTITAVGHIVNKRRLRNKKWQVAFHFDNISTKHRDSLIQFLLGEQRRQLREKVQTRS